MNLKNLTIILVAVLLANLLAACTSVESKTSSGEIVLTDQLSSNNNNNEVVITDSDLKTEPKLVVNTQEAKSEEKQILGDKTEVETLIDGFGNKTETRYFPGHPRLRFIILRTAVDGKKELTVYSYENDTKMVPELADKALTASGDEIANAANLRATRNYDDPPNFMLKGKRNVQQLQPLPSSAFQTPVAPANQPVEQPQSESSVKPQNSVTEQTKIENEY